MLEVCGGEGYVFEPFNSNHNNSFGDDVNCNDDQEFHPLGEKEAASEAGNNAIGEEFLKNDPHIEPVVTLLRKMFYLVIFVGWFFVAYILMAFFSGLAAEEVSCLRHDY